MGELSEGLPTTELASDEDGYELARSDREYRRLALQAQIWERATRRALDQVALRSGAHALDAGCGTGDVMRLMAECVGDRGRVTGVDVDPRLGETVLPQLVAERPEIYCAVTADVTQLSSIPDAPFDLVFARLLLFHMSRPVDTLQRLWDWVRPGGVLLVMDYDLTGARSCPPHPIVERALRLVNGAFRRMERDIEIGTRMPSLFIEAGIGLPDACEVNSVVIAGAPSTMMVREVVASLRAVILRSQLADLQTIERIDRELAQTEFDSQFMRWPDLVTTWKRKIAS